MKNSARIVISASTIIGLILSTLPVASAKVSVNVSNNGEGSKTNVDVKSSRTTSYNSANTSDSSTYVEINQNGQKKVFDTSDGEVHYQSPDGNTKVDISNKSGTSVNVSANGGGVGVSAKDGKAKKNKKKERKREKKLRNEASTVKDMHFSLAEFLLGLWPF